MTENLKEKIAQRLWLFRPSDNWERDKVFYLHEADQILTLIRTSGLFLDTDMVKGLMFEKCVKCKKNKD